MSENTEKTQGTQEKKERTKKNILRTTYLKEKYLRKGMLPMIFCPGCGIGQIMNALVRAMEELQIDLDNVVFVSGIGCSGRVPGYMNASGIHTTHGRALAFATGIKLTNPNLKVIVVGGDGDLVGIGGNHFLHAVRRNLDVTVIAINNFTYGMTGGQASPTSPYRSESAIGLVTEYPLNISGLAVISGASYVARYTTAHPGSMIKAMKEALSRPGFCLVEVLSQCPTNYGRRNNLRTPADMLKWYRENTVMQNTKGEPVIPTRITFNPGEKITIGEFVKLEKPGLIDNYRNKCREMKQNYIKRLEQKELDILLHRIKKEGQEPIEISEQKKEQGGENNHERSQY